MILCTFHLSTVACWVDANKTVPCPSCHSTISIELCYAGNFDISYGNCSSTWVSVWHWHFLNIQLNCYHVGPEHSDTKKEFDLSMGLDNNTGLSFEILPRLVDFQLHHLSDFCHIYPMII